MTDAEADEAMTLALDFEPKAQLDEMILAVGNRWFALYCQQKFRLKMDDRKRPDDEAVREIAILMGLEDFLKAVKTKPAEVARRLLKKGANAEA